jgi:hypothetical protein
MKRIVAVTVVVVGTGCSDSTTTPSTPPPPKPVQVAGIWTLTETRTSVTGGECLDGSMQGTVGNVVTDTITITQNNSSLTAVTTANLNGVSCNWTGTADTDRLVLNLSSCQTNANLFGLKCANGASRDIRISSALINLIINAGGASYSGSKAETYNVYPAGTLSQVGTMVFNENATMSK